MKLCDGTWLLDGRFSFFIFIITRVFTSSIRFAITNYFQYQSNSFFIYVRETTAAAAHPGRHFLTFFFNDGWIWNSFLIYFDRTTSWQTHNKKNNNNIFYLTGQINTTNFEVQLLDFFVVVVVVLIWESTVLWRSPKCFINSTLFYESPPPKKIFLWWLCCAVVFFLFFFFVPNLR